MAYLTVTFEVDDAHAWLQVNGLNELGANGKTISVFDRPAKVYTVDITSEPPAKLKNTYLLVRDDVQVFCMNCGQILTVFSYQTYDELVQWLTQHEPCGADTERVQKFISGEYTDHQVNRLRKLPRRQPEEEPK